jgi:O-antigen/teichoic acid export membrane protein
MNKTRKVFMNTAYQIGGQFFHLLLNIVSIALIARYLGVERYGTFSLVFVILSFFIIMADFGVNDIFVRELAKDKTKISRLVLDLLALKALLGLVCIGLSLGVVGLMGYSREILTLYAWLSISLLFHSLGSVGTNIFRVNLWMERAVLANMAKDAALLGIVYLVIRFRGDLLAIVGAFVAANLVYLVVTFVLMREVLRGPLPPFDPVFWRKIFRSAFPLGLAYIIVALYAGIDVVLLDRMVGDEAVGYYNASYKFVYQAIVIPVALMNSIFPLMSDYWNTNREKLKALFQKAFDYMVLMAIPLGMVVTVTARKLILLIYGEDYVPSILALRILIWGAAVMFMSIVFGGMMVALNEQKKSLVIDGCALALNFSLNLLLIPAMTFIGASVATVITELFVLTPTIYFIQKKMQFRLSLVPLAKSFCVGALCSSLLVATDSLNLFVQLGIGAAAYAALAYQWKLIPKRDLQLILQRSEAKDAL